MSAYRTPEAWFVRTWGEIRCVLRLLDPARFSFLTIILVAVVFLYNDQGMELIRALGESWTYAEQGGEHHRRSTVFFLMSLVLLGLANWYFARLLLNVRFPHSLSTEELQRPYLRLIRKWAPRLLGMLPALLSALGCWRVATSYDAGSGKTPGLPLALLATGCIAVAVFLCGFFIFRRRFLDEPLPGEGERPHFESFCELLSNKGVRNALILCLLPALLLMVVFMLWPVGPAQKLGAASILILAMAAWVALGSLVSYFGSAYRYPSVLTAIVLAGLFSIWNDNHQIRTLPSPERVKPSVAEAMDKWHSEVNTLYPLAKGKDGQPVPRPLFIVAAAGGGIRAAYWTALVLASLEDAARENKRASFAAHTFAISGVSGGALGATIFNAALTEGDRPLRARVKNVLDDDFLAPALGRMLFPDLVQRFLPIQVTGTDRAEALEMGWEAAWLRHRQGGTKNPLAENLLSLWEPRIEVQGDRFPHPGGPLPHLLLNGTMVENGKRIITSDLAINRAGSPIDEEFLDAVDASNYVHGAVRLSTAAHSSARFTYVSPAGTLKYGKHLVDGGYFENSGATTALDVLRIVQEKGWDDVAPVIILIDNGPKSTKASGESYGEPAVFNEVRAPLATMLATREARGSYAERAVARSVLFRAVKGQAGEGARIGGESVAVVRFNLANRKVPLPLGWMLSAGAIEEMNNQMDSAVAAPEFDNPGKQDFVISMLPQ